MIIDDERNDNGPKDTLKDFLRLLTFGVLCLLPFLQDLPTYQRSVEAEVLANKQVMTINGYSAAQGVAKQFYNVVMTDLGVYQFINVSLKNTRTPDDKFEEFWAQFLIVSDRIVDNVPLLVFQIGWRFGVAVYWILYFVPFFAACIYSGVQHWRLSLAQSSGAKIERFKLYRSATRITFFLFVLYLLIPPAGAATLAKYLVPGGLFLCGVMLNRMIASYHKMV